MASGLLPRNQGPIFSSNGTFGSVTTNYLSVVNAATINALSLTGVLNDPTAVNALTLEPNGTITYRTIASLPFEAADVYPNATPNHTVALVTTGGNANVLLSPNGSGQVVVQAGTTLQADRITQTNPSVPLGLATSVGSGADIVLAPDGTGQVIVETGTLLTADSIAPSAAGGALTLSTLASNANINLQPNGTGFVAITGVTNDNTQTNILTVNSSNELTYRTVSSLPSSFTASDVYPNATPNHTVALVTTGGNANVLLAPNGTGEVVTSAGTTFTADTITSTSAGPLSLYTTAGNIQLNPGPGDSVVVVTGAPLSTDKLQQTNTGFPLTILTAAGSAQNIDISPDGAGEVVVKAGTTFTADTLSTTSAGNLTLTTSTPASIILQPNGAGSVTVPSGHEFITDGIESNTPSTVPVTFSSTILVGNTQSVRTQTLDTTIPASTLSVGGTNTAAIALNPGSGSQVNVAAGHTLTADTISPTTSGGALTLSTTASNANINLQPNGTGFVAITGVANDNTQTNILTVNSSNELTYRTVASLPATFVASNTYSNATTNHTVTLSTTGGSANVLLSPNGAGQVVTQAGTTFTADVIAPTTASGTLTLETTGGPANIMLQPNSTGAVVVKSAALLFVDTVHPTTVNGALTLATPSATSGAAGGAVDLTAGLGGDSVTTGTPGAGGAIVVTTGHGGLTASGTSTSGVGGAFTVTCGNGGIQNSSGPGGAGGAITLAPGNGATNGSGAQVAGAGGSFSVTAGSGGASSDSASVDGGMGGNIILTAGAGGAPMTNPLGQSGAGGFVEVFGGTGAAGLASAANGPGGPITIQAGFGAASTTTLTGGAGGALSLLCGNGGAGTTGNPGGAGGSLIISAGQAGAGSTTAASGGSVTISGGDSSPTTGASSPGGNVFIRGGHSIPNIGPNGNVIIGYDQAISGRLGTINLFTPTVAIPGLNICIDGTQAFGMGLNNAVSGAGNNMLLAAGGAASSSATDAAGGNLILAAGAPTGLGDSTIRLKTALGTTSGTTVDAIVDRLTINGSRYPTNTVAFNVANIPFPVSASPPVGGSVFLTYTVTVTDGTNIQLESGYVGFSVVKTGATYAQGVLGPTNVQAIGSGTLATVWGFNVVTNDVFVTVTSSLTPTAGTGINLAVTLDNNSTLAVTAL